MWSTFTTTVDIYAGANGIGVGCSGNASNPVAVSETLASPLCLRVAASLWARLPALCSDDDRVGQPLDWFTNGNCTGPPLELDPSASYHGGFGFCSRAALPSGARSYTVRCISAPSGATAAWVVTLAALIALSALGLILFWLWRDREAVRAAAREEGLALQRSAHVGALTDSSYVQLLHDGIAAIDLGFPCRYTHSSLEMCDPADLAALTQLLLAGLTRVDAGFSLNRDDYT